MTHRVIVGVAGAGKTSAAMGVIEDELRSGLKWHQIGFASFSRAACLEAAERAARLTGEDLGRLQKQGWFRTVHSCALRALGVDTKCVLDHDSADGKKFLKDAVGSERGGEPGTLAAKVDEILSAWDWCRARLTLLTDADDGERLSGTDKSNPGQTGTDVGRYVSRVLGAEKTSDLIGLGTIGDSIPAYSGSLNNQNDPYGIQNNLSRVPLDNIPYRTQGKCEPSTHEVLCPARHECGAKSKNAMISEKIRDTRTKVHLVQGAGRALIQTYERQKKLYGRLDFSDILLSFAGVAVREDLAFYQTYPNGFVPEEVEVWLMDEWQDASPLLGMVAQRLAEAARDVYWLGDRYQSIFAFSGASASVFASLEDQAKEEGNRILLNRSWRNPEQVLEWGEEILREDRGYDERKPISEASDGSVGLMDSVEFESVLPLLAGSDTMILARTWFALNRVKARLDELVIPWKSCQEKTSSRWECPAKIAYTLVMRQLMEGDMISEQDFRRITETLPQKWQGQELFVRGTKAKWKKAECSGQPRARLDGLTEWGATPGLIAFVREGKWRDGMPLLLDVAIEKHGIQEVRDPSVRIGSVHSIKGMEARNVFCLAASTQRIEQDGDPEEELCLKYVAVTRASKHYRLVVDQMDVARGRPLFWAAPRGSKDWVKGFDDAGIRHSGGDHPVDEGEGLDLDREVSWGDLWESRDAGSAAVGEREIRRDGSEGFGGTSGENAGADGGTDPDEWWNL